MPSPRTLRLLLLALLLGCGVPAMATVAADVCTGDPCVLSRPIEVTAGSTLDFGARAFRIATNGRLSTGNGDVLTIRARTVTMQPGALIRGPLTPTLGISVLIDATEDIVIQRSGTARARIEVQAQQGNGSIELHAGGNVDLSGDLRADGTTADASGGNVEILAGGDLTMTGEMKVNGGLAGDGGIITIRTEGAMVVGKIDASGGASGGSIELTSEAGLNTAGVLSVAGTAAASSGGELTLVANGGSVFIDERMTTQAEGSLTDGGDGGEIDVSADGNVLIFGRLDTFASGPGGQGGFVTIDAGADIRQSETISAHGATGADGSIGIDLSAGGLLTLDALIDVHGVSGGDVLGEAGGEVRARGEINADGENGDIHLTTRAAPPTQVRGPVVVSGNLHARALAGGTSGLVRIEGCDVTIDAAARLTTAGAAARNHLKSSRQLTVAGELIAGPPGENLLQFRNPPGLTPTVDVTRITPPPNVQPTTDLLPCAGAPPPPVCPNGMVESGEECDDDNTTACDGCSASCTREECGNGMTECAELCDDDNVVDGDGCDANCTPTGCGNERVTAGEECDDGNTTPGDGCDATCHIEAPATCGNGMVDEGEECDGGNATDCDGCSHLCLNESCGDNRRECAEVCDDGGTVACDGECAADCSRLVSCGDGIAECGETCDAGANNGRPGSGCNTSCRVCAIGSGADCPCDTDFECSPSGRCAGLACVGGVCASVEVKNCSNGDLCDGEEPCSNGECGRGTPLQCADADPCTVDSCNPAVGCLHTATTGIPSVACRVEAFRLALDAAPDQVQAKLRARLDGGAAKLQAVVDTAALTTDNVKLRRLLKKAAKRAKKLVRLVNKGARKDQLPAALADTLRSAADGAFTAAQGIRGGLLT